MGRPDGSLLATWIQCGRWIVLGHRAIVASARDVGSEIGWIHGTFQPKDSLFICTTPIALSGVHAQWISSEANPAPVMHGQLKGLKSYQNLLDLSCNRESLAREGAWIGSLALWRPMTSRGVSDFGADCEQSKMDFLQKKSNSNVYSREGCQISFVAHIRLVIDIFGYSAVSATMLLV